MPLILNILLQQLIKIVVRPPHFVGRPPLNAVQSFVVHNLYLNLMTFEQFPGSTGKYFEDPSFDPDCNMDLESPSCSYDLGHVSSEVCADSPVSMDTPMEIMIKEEDPFTSQSQHLPEEQPSMVQEATVVDRPIKIKEGCKCKKSQCRKSYCPCFKAGINCTDKCGCINCKCNKYTEHLFCIQKDYSFKVFQFKHKIQKK